MLWLIELLFLLYGILYTAILLFLDCDLELAYYERFGKSIGHLKGKVVFITGASSGIGEQTAIALAKYDVKLVLAARRRNELERVKAACLAVSEGTLSDADILILAFDLCDLDQQKPQFDHAVRHFGSVDILFNNAGRYQLALWENIEIPVDKQIFDLNVFSVVNLSRVALKHFNSKGSGHIAVTSSLAGFIGVPYSGSYTGAKHAIHGYMNSLRTEKMGKNITVSLLCPGPTYTNFLRETFTEKSGDKYRDSTSTDKRMSAERCGKLCAVALANKSRESWMGVPPLVLFTYVAVYFPLIFYWILKFWGPERIFKFKDSKDATVTQEVQVQRV